MNKKIVLIGNPNCGKTTFFNKITGGNEYVGNRAGVTVKEKVRKIKGENILLWDLPGIYSLSGYTKDEKTALRVLSEISCDGIINIADGTNLERSLYLTICLRELNIPMILAVNMKDECDKNKIRIDIKKLSEFIGVKTVFVSSLTREGFPELIDAVKNIKPSDIHIYDSFIKKLYSCCKSEEHGDYKKANCVYRFAEKIASECVCKEKNKKGFSYYADRIILNKYAAFPLMLLYIGAAFYIIFGPVGEAFKKIILMLYTNIFINFPEPFYNSLNPAINSVISDGIVRGGEALISFLPHLFLLFVFITFTEDSGYMSRIAYISDKPMRKFGFSGKSVISLLLGFGCTLSAVMSARIIKNEKEREKTIFLLPFMSCGAKISVYSIFASLFFKEKFFAVVMFLYLFGVLMFFLTAKVFMKKTNSEEVFFLELPKYRLPSLKTVIRTAFFQLRDFIKRAGSLVILFSVMVWFLNNFDFCLSKVSSENSILSVVGKKISVIFSPLGFGNYQACTALVSGIFAKESIAVLLTILSGGTENIPLLFDKAQAISFMVFTLFYTPCLSASAAIVKESSSKVKALCVLILYTLAAYVLSFVTYRVIM